MTGNSGLFIRSKVIVWKLVSVIPVDTRRSCDVNKTPLRRREVVRRLILVETKYIIFFFFFLEGLLEMENFYTLFYST